MSQIWRLGTPRAGAPAAAPAAAPATAATAEEEAEVDTMEERVGWLVSMGFPEAEVREVVRKRMPSTDQLSVEQVRACMHAGRSPSARV